MASGAINSSFGARTEPKPAPSDFAIEPQRDVLRGTPAAEDGSTWFEVCDEGDAEQFAVFDVREGVGGAGPAWIEDFPTRAEAEAYIDRRCQPSFLTARRLRLRAVELVKQYASGQIGGSSLSQLAQAIAALPIETDGVQWIKCHGRKPDLPDWVIVIPRHEGETREEAIIEAGRRNQSVGGDTRWESVVEYCRRNPAYPTEAL